VEAPSFCQALAIPLKMKPPVLPQRPFWRRDMLGSFANFMFGGTSSVSVGIRPPEPRTVESIDKAAESCKSDKKGASCSVSSPNSLIFLANDMEIVVEPAAAETAEVTVHGTIVECRDKTTSSLPLRP
jgi:hypothetical protein